MSEKTMEQRIQELEARIQRQEDIEEIRRLRRKYAEAGDGGWPKHNDGKTHNAEAFAALFTDDGVWDGSEFSSRAEGKEEIKKVISSFQSMPHQIHFTTLGSITINPDGVTAQGDWHVMTPADFPDGECAISFAYYHDKYVKDPVKGWLFKEVVIEDCYAGTLNGEEPFKWHALEEGTL